MEGTEEQEKKKATKIKTFPVPLASTKTKENISSNTSSKPSKELIINQAFKFHSKGNISEASKYYQFFINQGFKDHRIFSNYGSILKDLGKLQEAKLYTLKAIDESPNCAEYHFNLGNILKDLEELQEAEKSFRKAMEIKPSFLDAAWFLYLLSNNIEQAEERLNQCLKMDQSYFQAYLHLSAVKLHQGNRSLLKKLLSSTQKDNPMIRTLIWVSNLPKLPKIFFRRRDFYDEIINQSIKNRPFYEFGVYEGRSFKYLIKTLKKGFGFDTFDGLPEKWNDYEKGAFSTNGIIPKIDGGTFIAGLFADSLPIFFSEPRPKASIINFDADLFSSTLCALNYSKSIIDKETILIFDELIVHKNWENDEYKALNEFCSKNNLRYEVLAVSYTTFQTALKVIDL